MGRSRSVAFLMRGSLPIIAASMLAFLLSAPVSAQSGSSADAGILVLTSYGEGRPGISSVLSGFASVLAEAGLRPG